MPSSADDDRGLSEGSAGGRGRDTDRISDRISLAVVNARVRTGDPRRPWADAIAVRGALVAAVGSSAAVRKMAGGGARVIDARGRTVVPGTLAGEEGVLARGAIADFVILDRDPAGGLAAAHAARGERRALVTVVGGRVVHEEIPHP